MNKHEFEQDKQRRMKDTESSIELIKNGAMLQSLELQLKLIERQTFERNGKDRRFIVN